MPFAALGLSAPLLKALQLSGYTTPTPIQAQAIPPILAGRDVLAAAQTGTGKTAGFTLPILERLGQIDFSRSEQKAKIKVLILTPTRELASQIEECITTYAQCIDIKSMVMFGGVNIKPQIQKLNRRIDILVATPGRLLDHVGQGTLDLSGIQTLVLDEADRMLDMGFIRDIRRILPLLPASRQNLLFSATFSGEIKTLAMGIMNNPVIVEVARQNTTAERIEQVVYPVDRVRKTDLLKQLIHNGSWEQVLVFCRTKHGANRLAESLADAGISAAAIHGNKSQAARERALADFKQNKLRVLVATDIAARGIDIDQLPHVVNFELPNTPEDYVHRIGRTGRAGSEGQACSLVCIDEVQLLQRIEKLIKLALPKIIIDGFEVDPSIKAEPIRKTPPPRNHHNSNRPSKPGSTQPGKKPFAHGKGNKPQHNKR